MRIKKINSTTGISINKSYEGQTIEEFLRDATETNEPISGSSPMLYTERKDGVLAETDIRTDRWEIAQNTMAKDSKNRISKRTPNPNSSAEATTGAESTNTTN